MHANNNKLDAIQLRGECGDDAGAASEPGDGAVRREETRRQVLVCAAHDGHLRLDVQLGHVARAVGLPQHAVHVLAEVLELEAQVQVHQAVPPRLAVLVNPVVLLRDGHGVGRDAEHAVELHRDGVHVLHAPHGEAGQGLGHPAGVLDGVVDVHGLPVEDDLDMVFILIPLDGLAGADVEAVAGAEGDAQGLHPREVAFQVRVVVADEVGVDVEVGVGDDAEVLVFLAVEVEGVAVAAGEARVAAGGARENIAL
jgi:hypothetical protein